MDQEEQLAAAQEQVDSRYQSVEAEPEAESKEQSLTEQHEEEVAEAEQSGEAEEQQQQEEGEGEGEEEAGEDEDEEQEGIQSGQLSHREHEEDEEGQQEVEGDQEIVDDEKENQQVDEGARVKKKSDLDILLEKQSKERQRNRKKKGDSEELNEMDNVISGMITEMKQVAAVSVVDQSSSSSFERCVDQSPINKSVSRTIEPPTKSQCPRSRN